MTSDRRTAVRVRLDRMAALLHLDGEAEEHRVDVVNVSPQGACVAVPWSAESATEKLFNAWMRSGAVRLRLDGSEATTTARIHWARAFDHDQPLFGLHFVEPIRCFAPLVRQLTTLSD